MIENHINEVINKYFDKIYYIPQFSEQKLIELVDPIIEKAIANLKLSKLQREAITVELKEGNNLVFTNLKNSLTSIRKIIKFSQVLKANLNKVRNNIYLPDIVIMSIIEATYLKTFDFIRRHKEELSLYPTSNDVEQIITGVQFKRLKTFYPFAQEKDYINKLNKEAVEFLFPYFKIALTYEDKDYYKHMNLLNKEYSKAYENAVVKKRITLDLLFTLFFAHNDIDTTIATLLSQDYKDELLLKLSKIQIEYEVEGSLLKPLFPQGNYNRDLRKNSNLWLKGLIQNYESHELCVNNLISLSFLVKEKNIDFSIEEKDSLARLVWTYIERHDVISYLERQEILFKLLDNEDNSDVFANLILYKVIYNDSGRITLDDNIKISVAEKFLSRIDNKLKKGKSPKERSVFNQNYFDDTIATIWRWHQAAKFIKDKGKELHILIDLATHLDDFLSNSHEDFELLFKSSFNDFYDSPYDKIAFLPEEIFNIITKEHVAKLVEKYLKSKNYESFDDGKIKALEDWLKNYDESNSDLEE
ncbi:MAG: hypothetical protein PF445_02840 [Melioribacteraceae bacterium]|jgi:hypothetical protein|nr:hypothetical protein [Melioribacteraceae bacterium]